MFKKLHFINITKQPIIVLLAKTSFAFQMRNYSRSRTAPKSLFYTVKKYPLHGVVSHLSHARVLVGKVFFIRFGKVFFIMFKYPLYCSEKYTNGRREFWFLNP